MFSKSLEKELTKGLMYNSTAVLVTDYQPWFLLGDVLIKSGIEDIPKFLYRARFPTKSRVQIYHDHVELYLNGDQMPMIWFDDNFLLS